MDIVKIILGVLQISMLDIILSGDNVGVIALAIKNLPHKYAKKASMIGVTTAVILRIFFACIITYILLIQWLPIKLFGGLLLVKITWNLIKEDDSKSDVSVKPSGKFINAVISIVIADATMSLDNIIAIAASAGGQIGLIIFGLMLNIPIIFYGSQYVAKLMVKFPMAVYLGGSILAHTSFKMIFEDNLIRPYFPNYICIIIPYIAAVITILYGFYITGKLTSDSVER